MNNETFLKFQKIIGKFNRYSKYADLKLDNVSQSVNIPILGKEDLRVFNFKDAPENPAIIWNTSGTTGGVSLIGISKSNYDVFLSRCDLVLKKHVEPFLKSDKKTISNMVEVFSDSYFIDRGYSVLSSGRTQFDNEEYNYIAERHSKTKPNIIIGTAPFIFEVLDRSKTGEFVDVIIFGGAFYGKAFLNKIKKLAPNAKIIETYSFTECNFFAFRDPFKQEYYDLIVDSNIYLEVLSKTGEICSKGQGTMLFTDFANLSSPLIRYKVGDDIELKKDNDKIKIKLLGRADTLIKIKNDLVPYDEIIQRVIDILEHDRFKIEFNYREGTAREYVVFYLSKVDEKSKENLKNYFLFEFDIKVFFKELDFDDIKTSYRAKKEHIVDNRHQRMN